MAEIEIQRLESVEDVYCLMDGDVVNVVYEYFNGDREPTRKALVLEKDSGKIGFAIKHPSDEGIIRVYTGFPGYVSTEDGKGILREGNHISIINSTNKHLITLVKQIKNTEI